MSTTRPTPADLDCPFCLTRQVPSAYSDNDSGYDTDPRAERMVEIVVAANRTGTEREPFAKPHKAFRCTVCRYGELHDLRPAAPFGGSDAVRGDAGAPKPRPPEHDLDDRDDPWEGDEA